METAAPGEAPTRSDPLEQDEKQVDDPVERAADKPDVNDQPFLLTGWRLNALMCGLGLCMLLVGLVGTQSYNDGVALTVTGFYHGIYCRTDHHNRI